MLAKNVFHALLFGVDMLLVVALASWRMGRPDGAVLAATGTWLLFALPVHLAAGNVLSLKLPYRANLGRIGRQRGFQAGAMLSLVMQAAVLGVGAGVFALCTLLAGSGWRRRCSWCWRRWRRSRGCGGCAMQKRWRTGAAIRWWLRW